MMSHSESVSRRTLSFRTPTKHRFGVALGLRFQVLISDAGQGKSGQAVNVFAPCQEPTDRVDVKLNHKWNPSCWPRHRTENQKHKTEAISFARALAAVGRP